MDINSARLPSRLASANGKTMPEKKFSSVFSPSEIRSFILFDVESLSQSTSKPSRRPTILCSKSKIAVSFDCVSVQSASPVASAIDARISASTFSLSETPCGSKKYRMQPSAAPSRAYCLRPSSSLRTWLPRPTIRRAERWFISLSKAVQPFGLVLPSSVSPPPNMRCIVSPNKPMTTLSDFSSCRSNNALTTSLLVSWLSSINMKGYLFTIISAIIGLLVRKFEKILRTSACDSEFCEELIPFGS